METTDVEPLEKLLDEVRRCSECGPHLPHVPRPVVQAHPEAKILIVSQAPGRRVHESGVPFDDPSGDRLRQWMGIDRHQFYDERRVAILPMGFCYPGTGSSGDLPPRPECAPRWRKSLLSHLQRVSLTLVVGRYAQAYHLNNSNQSVTAYVRAWRHYIPHMLPLPHPSPRNVRWLRHNSWFESEVIPWMQSRIRTVMAG